MRLLLSTQVSRRPLRRASLSLSLSHMHRAAYRSTFVAFAFPSLQYGYIIFLVLIITSIRFFTSTAQPLHTAQRRCDASEITLIL